MNNSEYIDVLERCIDANNLQETLQMISTICWEKASHALTNRQDGALAEAWEKAALTIEKLSIKEAILHVSN